MLHQLALQEMSAPALQQKKKHPDLTKQAESNLQLSESERSAKFHKHSTTEHCATMLCGRREPILNHKSDKTEDNQPRRGSTAVQSK